MATRSANEPTEAERGTAGRELNRGASLDRGSAKASPTKPRKATAEQDRRAAAEAAERDRKKYEAVGLIANQKYEFKDAKKRSSYVVLDQNTAIFVDRAGKSFLKMGFANLWEVIETTGDNLEKATRNYESSGEFRAAQIGRYYRVFKPGNALAANTLGSGQFKYEIAKQHLADSVGNELEHVAHMLGLASAETFFAQFTDKDPGMECWGTTVQNLLKARGLVPPTLERQEFERNYAGIVAKLEPGYRGALFGSLSALKKLGIPGTRTAIEAIQAQFTNLEWARFTGMSDRKATVTLLSTEKEVETEVRRGYAVFVGVPGHYKSAIGVSGSGLEYDDPLGFWGHRLYDGKPARFGVVIK